MRLPAIKLVGLLALAGRILSQPNQGQLCNDQSVVPEGSICCIAPDGREVNCGRGTICCAIGCCNNGFGQPIPSVVHPGNTTSLGNLTATTWVNVGNTSTATTFGASTLNQDSSIMGHTALPGNTSFAATSVVYMTTTHMDTVVVPGTLMTSHATLSSWNSSVVNPTNSSGLPGTLERATSSRAPLSHSVTISKSQEATFVKNVTTSSLSEEYKTATLPASSHTWTGVKSNTTSSTSEQSTSVMNSTTSTVSGKGKTVESTATVVGSWTSSVPSSTYKSSSISTESSKDMAEESSTTIVSSLTPPHTSVTLTVSTPAPQWDSSASTSAGPQPVTSPSMTNSIPFTFPSFSTTSQESVTTIEGPVTSTEGRPGMTLPSLAPTSQDSTAPVEGPKVTPTEGVPGMTLPPAPGPLVKYKEWPPEARIEPVGWIVTKVGKENDKVVMPCNLWFFFFCVDFIIIRIYGWELNLPPGIYPPGPPPIKNVLLPTILYILGVIPPWPEFTVGNDGIPTFPAAPEPTQCSTRTASICASTSTIVITSVTSGLQTLSTMVSEQTCEEMRGCFVHDLERQATVRTTLDCSTSTVTDLTFVCSGTASSDCRTKTAATKTGCDMTATTTTVSCTKATAGQVVPTSPSRIKRQMVPGDGGEPAEACPLDSVWYVWPKEHKNKAQNGLVQKELERIGSKVEVSSSSTLGISFWTVHMDDNQAKEVREVAGVARCYRQCLDCVPLWTETDWRYQNEYTPTSKEQMAFFSTEDPNGQPLDPAYPHRAYFFDKSAGDGVPVYLVDSGCNLAHPEFDDIRETAEFRHVGLDYDGLNHNDDSGIPLGQVCDLELGACTAHGTAMLAAITGKTLGVSKRVKPIIVRVPRRNPTGGGNSVEDLLTALELILEDFPERSTKTRAIASLSAEGSWAIYYKSRIDHVYGGTALDIADDFEAFVRRMAELVRELTANGVFCVASVGNRPEVDSWPALLPVLYEDAPWEFKDMWPESVSEVLVVGALNHRDGLRYLNSGFLRGANGDDDEMLIPHVYAPGYKCVNARGNMGEWDSPINHYYLGNGTSGATAMTSGLAAYFLGLHQAGRLPPDPKGNPVPVDLSPAELHEYMINTAWVRATGQEYVGDTVRGA